jgi:hypothetical protein
MYLLKKYIDIVEGTALLENPWQATDPAKAAAWTALSPEDQKWLGNADPTDTIILARAPNKGKPTQNVAPTSQQGQQLAAQTAGMDEPASGQAGVQGGSQQDNMLAAQTAGMDEPAAATTAAAPAAPAGGASAEGNAGEAEAKAAMAAKTQPAGGDTGEVPGVTTQSGATATAPTAPTGQSATPAPAASAAGGNRDAMPFGKAFADAKSKGEKEFTWKGKKYAVKMAAPKQAATPAKALPGKAVPGALTSMMGNIDPATGMPSNPMPESITSNMNRTESKISESYMKELNAMRRIAGLNELDMNAMMKSLGNMPGADVKNTSSNTSNFKSNINGKQDDSEAGYNSAMGKFNDMAKGMNLPGGAKLDPSNIQGSIDGIQKGIMGKFGDISKRTGTSAPGANIPNPPSANQKQQDPKDILKGMPEDEIERLSGDDAKDLLNQLKQLSGM